MRLAPFPMRRLLRTVAADRHAAPPSRVAPRVVGEQQRAGRAFAGFHLGEVLGADEPRQRFADRGAEVRRACASGEAAAARKAACLSVDKATIRVKISSRSSRRFSGVELGKSVSRQGAALVLTHEAPEPFAQAARLIRDLVQFAGQGVRAACPGARRPDADGPARANSAYPSPSSIQSMAVSTGVAIELRKSSPAHRRRKSQADGVHITPLPVWRLRFGMAAPQRPSANAPMNNHFKAGLTSYADSNRHNAH